MGQDGIMQILLHNYNANLKLTHLEMLINRKRLIRTLGPVSILSKQIYISALMKLF
jgi:hypothetical protein